MNAKLVLASSSSFRQMTLQKLNIDFEVDVPDVDESPLDNESPLELVKRLSELKATAVGARHPGALIIGSDQVAVLDGEIITKPLNHENAVAQLTKASGRRVQFLTGLCLYNSATGAIQLDCIPFTVYFRKLNAGQIERYLQKDQPYQSAGSFKSEGYGITLFEKLEGDDPNSLVGLPLIRLVNMLQEEGIQLP